MNSFLVALQFLTRIQLSKNTNWEEKEFGKSVSCFTLVGLLIGVLSLLLYHLLLPLHLSYLMAFILVIFDFFITGGTLYDGLMDASDGLFSGRTKERALEIMKDSSVGSFGLCIMLIVFFSKVFSLGSCDGPLDVLLIAMPVMGRLALAMSICLYPYARPYGMGKSFSFFHTRMALPADVLVALLPVIFFGFMYCVLLGLGILFCLGVNHFVVSKIDGTTGDTYGFSAETTEAFLAVIFVILSKGIACLT